MPMQDQGSVGQCLGSFGLLENHGFTPTSLCLPDEETGCRAGCTVHGAGRDGERPTPATGSLLLGQEQ